MRILDVRKVWVWTWLGPRRAVQVLVDRYHEAPGCHFDQWELVDTVDKLADLMRQVRNSMDLAHANAQPGPTRDQLLEVVIQSVNAAFDWKEDALGYQVRTNTDDQGRTYCTGFKLDDKDPEVAVRVASIVEEELQKHLREGGKLGRPHVDFDGRPLRQGYQPAPLDPKLARCAYPPKGL